MEHGSTDRRAASALLARAQEGFRDTVCRCGTRGVVEFRDRGGLRTGTCRQCAGRSVPASAGPVVNHGPVLKPSRRVGWFGPAIDEAPARLARLRALEARL